jgi:hypothetical protein
VGCRVVVGPGPIELRTKIVEHARGHGQLFGTARGSLNEKFKTILSKKVLTKNDLDAEGPNSVEMRLNAWWSDFLGQTLPAIVKAFENLSLD